MQLSYFDDPAVQCLRSLDSVESKDAQQKFDYFNKLSAAVPLFPEVSEFESASQHAATVAFRCRVIKPNLSAING